MAIAGLLRLNRKMRSIPVEAKKAARAAVVSSAGEIAALQKSLAPVDQGDLKDSVHVTLPGGTTPKYSQPGGAKVAGPEQAIITAGNTDVRYAHLVEFGTKSHPQGGQFVGTTHPGTTAQPFFWPGYRALRSRSKSRISRSISKSIRQAAMAGGSAP